MTPAVTPASTASEKRRRSSIRSLARTRISLRCDFSSSSILLNVSPSERDIAVGGAHRNRDVEIAGRHLVGGADQLADRPHQPVGDRDAGPDRRQDDDQRQAEIEQRERDLRRSAGCFEPAILVRFGPHDLARLDHLGVDQADRVEVGIRRSRRSLTMAPTMLRGRRLDQHRLPSAVTGRTAILPAMLGMSKSGLVLRGHDRPNRPALTSAAWASARPIACWVIRSRKPVRSRL